MALCIEDISLAAFKTLDVDQVKQCYCGGFGLMSKERINGLKSKYRVARKKITRDISADMLNPGHFVFLKCSSNFTS